MNPYFFVLCLVIQGRCYLNAQRIGASLQSPPATSVATHAPERCLSWLVFEYLLRRPWFKAISAIGILSIVRYHLFWTVWAAKISDSLNSTFQKNTAEQLWHSAAFPHSFQGNLLNSFPSIFFKDVSIKMYFWFCRRCKLNAILSQYTFWHFR